MDVGQNLQRPGFFSLEAVRDTGTCRKFRKEKSSVGEGELGLGGGGGVALCTTCILSGVRERECEKNQIGQAQRKVAGKTAAEKGALDNCPGLLSRPA